MKTKTLAVGTLLGCLILSSCGKTPVPDPLESLDEAINNTTYYGLYSEGLEGEHLYTELNGEDTYCFTADNYGYTVLENDPGYLHFFSLDYDDEIEDFRLVMNGRVGKDTDFESATEGKVRFMDLLSVYSDHFGKKDGDPWVYYATGYDMSESFKDYFQLHAFSYCNYYEVTIGYDYRIRSFRAGEYYESDFSDLVIDEEYQLDAFDLNRFSYYSDWVKNGSVTETRIIDYKSFYEEEGAYHTTYENGTIEATVTAVDYDGSFFIANYDEFNGAVGMRVVPKDGTYVPEAGDRVTVSGTISLPGFGRYAGAAEFRDAEVTCLGKETYPPCFSEEAIVDFYGGGTYAVYYLHYSPVYTGSLYQAYAYPTNIPDKANEDGDTEITLLCPEYKYDADQSYYSMTLVIPSEYGTWKTNSLLEELRGLGDYMTDKNDAEMAYIGNVVSLYDYENPLSVRLLALPNSSIGHRESYEELIEKEYGLNGLLVPDDDTETRSGYFHFGPSTDYYLEEEYGLSGHDTSGLYYYTYSASESETDEFFASLEGNGFVLLDIVSTSLLDMTTHYIYEKDDLYADVSLYGYEGATMRFELFLYQAEKEVRVKSIEEKIEKACGSYFSGNDFIRLSGTYDRDYHFYQLTNYAGNKFSEESPLCIATLDIVGSRYNELREAYRNAGWKQWREDINDSSSKAYTYVTRGVSHIVYYRKNSNGNYTFIDFASYPTSDYTFLNHDRFDPRIEMAIYEGKKPLSTVYTTDMTPLVEEICEFGKDFAFKWKLPSCYKAEAYDAMTDGGEQLDYGYCYGSDYFLYTDGTKTLDELYDYVIDTFESHGFTLAFNGKKSVTYEAEKGDYSTDDYQSAYVCIMKDSSRGFVRVISGIGGADF